MCCTAFIFFTPTMYNAYNNADKKTIPTPYRFKLAPLFPLYKRVIPTEVNNIEEITVFVIFSLKNIAIMIATNTG